MLGGREIRIQCSSYSCIHSGHQIHIYQLKNFFAEIDLIGNNIQFKNESDWWLSAYNTIYLWDFCVIFGSQNTHLTCRSNYIGLGNRKKGAWATFQCSIDLADSDMNLTPLSCPISQRKGWTLSGSQKNPWYHWMHLEGRAENCVK